ncbi:hypothetical protein [Persicobacter sp. CCB-QB2]|uniref:hypothetical protein n=1 Tax=Persicobacter sp. CCB-QB2 TaxID=1561025 RepID=UPI0006A9FA75|nr:hypothetical protein [Persicobacter sp. CCB-QB2]
MQYSKFYLLLTELQVDEPEVTKEQVIAETICRYVNSLTELSKEEYYAVMEHLKASVKRYRASKNQMRRKLWQIFKARASQDPAEASRNWFEKNAKYPMTNDAPRKVYAKFVSVAERM